METVSNFDRDPQAEGKMAESKAGENLAGYNLNNDLRSPGIKTIQLSGTQLVITAELSGVFCQGVQYYDLKNIQFINNSGMASLIDLLKSLLKQGVQVEFVNVNDRIKKKIKSLGLDHILKCS